MFYLRNLKKLFKRAPFLILSYFLLAALVPMMIFNASKISKNIIKISKSGIQASFFHALINKQQNFTRYSRKLKSLPGVRNVEILSPEKMEIQANQILGDLELNLSSDILNIGYAGLKIIFEAGLKSESMELVRDYLERLVGSQNITIGELVKTENKNKKSGVWPFVSTYTSELIIASVLFLWLFSNFIFAKLFNNEMYLIQSFQRTKNIPLKIYVANALVLIVLPLTIISVLKFSLLPFSMVLIAIVLGAMPHVKRWQWISK